jgi:hypothetical protein
MQVFGLVSLLITIALIAWWFSLSHNSAPPGATPSSDQYDTALQSAERAAEQLSR